MAAGSEPPGRSRPTTAAMEAYEDLRQPAPGGQADHAGLVLLYAPGFQQLPPAFLLRGQEVFIGREAPAEILIPQPAVSRRHAKIGNDGHGWVLSDLGARNGTVVGGALVDHVRLRQNDEIRIGDGFFKFVERDAAGYLPYRLDGTVLSAPAPPSGIVGGYQLASIAFALERIAHSEMSVLITGESGAGKEVFARQIHAWSARRGSFCALNCAAIPATLLESELFGYRRGAFSGADRDHVGLVRAAHGGTLFLDEVGDLPLEAQAKLLRVLQTKEVLPLGATAPERVDVRVVCATNQDLATMQREGRFRADLFARLNEYGVRVPPLREHKEDLYALCRAFLARHQRQDLQLSVPYMTGVLHYDFPYNVRELEALIKRGVALAQGPVLGAEHLSEEIHATMRGYGARRGPAAGGADDRSAMITHPRPPAPSWPPPMVDEPTMRSTPVAMPAVAPSPAPGSPMAAPPPFASPAHPPSEAPTEQQLREALASHRGNVAAVGRQFGKERMQVHRWMKRYNIDPNQYR